MVTRMVEFLRYKGGKRIAGYTLVIGLIAVGFALIAFSVIPWFEEACGVLNGLKSAHGFLRRVDGFTSTMASKCGKS